MTPRRRILFGKLSEQQAIINAFKSRVAADAGTFEAEDCLNQTVARLRALGLYEQASLILTPNAYKASKLYAIKPTNGSADPSFTRAGAGSRRNLSGSFDALANNVPVLNYPSGGSCPFLSYQAQRTNLFLNPEAAVTQNITVVVGQVYTITTFGTVTATCSNAGVGVAANGESFTFTATTTTLAVTISGLSGQAYVNCGLGAWAWQTPIMIGAVSTTRPADVVPIQTNAALFGAGGVFTWKMKIRDNLSFANSGIHSSGHYVRAAVGNGLFLSPSSGTRLRLWTVAAGVLYTTLVNNLTMVVTSNGSVVNVWVNGVKVVNNFSYAIAADSYGFQTNSYINVEAFELTPLVLTDAECTALSLT